MKIISGRPPFCSGQLTKVLRVPVPFPYQLWAAVLYSPPQQDRNSLHQQPLATVIPRANVIWMIEYSKLEWGRQAGLVAQTNQASVDRGSALSSRRRRQAGGASARTAPLASQGLFSVGILRALGISRQPRVIECPQIAPNRQSSRVERAVTHSKQRVGVPSTRHRIGGMF
jgi:hypothetical protein